MLRRKNSRGDTIIEVLIALTISALAIGTSYAIAHKAMQKTIMARERDQAIGYLESQVNTLKLNEQNDPTGFPGSALVSTQHYCLDEGVIVVGSPHQNNAVTTLKSGVGTNYDPACVKNNGLYYLDIAPTSDITVTPATTFRLDVRWPGLGGGPDNDATFYYRF